MKKLSGIYVDNQGFSHTVYYSFTKRKYIKMIHSPKGGFCSSAEHTKEQIEHNIQGFTRSFSLAQLTRLALPN